MRAAERPEVGLSGSVTNSARAEVAELCAHRVEAAAMEATGVYWEAPWDALTDAGVEVQLLHAQQVKHIIGRFVPRITVREHSPVWIYARSFAG